MVLQMTTPLALSTRASARLITRMMVPFAFSIGVPPVAGSSSMEPRFCAAVASVCFLVQVIGLMARPPGSSTGWCRRQSGLGVPGDDDPGVVGTGGELQERVLCR